MGVRLPAAVPVKSVFIKCASKYGRMGLLNKHGYIFNQSQIHSESVTKSWSKASLYSYAEKTLVKNPCWIYFT